MRQGVIVVEERRSVSKRLSVALVSIVVAALPLSPVALAAPPTAGGRSGDGRASSAGARILVKFKGVSPDAAAADVTSRLGYAVEKRLPDLGVEVIRVKDASAIARAVHVYSADPRVEYAEPDQRMSEALVPNDPEYPSEWGMDAISAPAGWDISTGSTSTVVAIVDTGVAPHAEFAARLLKGYDFVNDDTDTNDDEGHGTSVAGIIGAAGGNRSGMAGVDWATKLLPVKVLDASGSGWTSDIAAGVTFAADNGARVINLSLGGPGKSSTLKRAIAYAAKKGVVIVAAAGNEATSAPSYPAAYADVLSVSALDRSGLANFSNFGTNVDVAAPGVSIRTISGPDTYGDFSGTSASAPFVTGLAALVVGRNPTLSAGAVSKIVTSTADDLGKAGWDASFGWGRIDVAAALRATAPLDRTAPVASLAAPAANARLKGSVLVRASATDNVGVTKVCFWIDRKLSATDTKAPFQWTWATRKTGNGWHTVVAKAYDKAGNVGTSKAVRVFVSN